MRLLIAIVMMVAACRGFRSKSHEPTYDERARAEENRDRVATYTNENSSVIELDLRVRKDLATAKTGDPLAASWALLDASQSIAQAVKIQKDSHDKPHVKIVFKIDNEGTFSNAQMLERLEKLEAEVTPLWAKAQPKAHKLWKKEYGATSETALAKLEELGKPGEVTRSKKQTCWVYGDDRYCWTKAGELAKLDHPSAATPGGMKLVGIMSDGDCVAVASRVANSCQSNNCQAFLLKQANLCETGDCVAIVFKDLSKCESKDCEAMIRDQPDQCASKDCRALVLKDAQQCESASCIAFLTHATTECK